MTQNIEKTNYIRFTYSDYKQSLFKLDRAYSNITRIENSNSNLNIIKFKIDRRGYNIKKYIL